MNSYYLKSPVPDPPPPDTRDLFPRLLKILNTAPCCTHHASQLLVLITLICLVALPSYSLRTGAWHRVGLHRHLLNDWTLGARHWGSLKETEKKWFLLWGTHKDSKCTHRMAKYTAGLDPTGRWYKVAMWFCTAKHPFIGWHVADVAHLWGCTGKPYIVQYSGKEPHVATENSKFGSSKSSCAINVNGFWKFSIKKEYKLSH